MSSTPTSTSSGTAPFSHRFALPILLLGAAAIAFAPIFVRLSEVPPTATAFLRCLLALPFLWAWMLMERRRARAAGETDTLRATGPQSWRDFALLSVPGLLFAGDLAFWHWSITLTSVANSTLLANFAPVFVTLGAWALFGIRASWKFLAGMVVALAGAVVLMADSLTLGDLELLGDGLALVTAVWYGAYLLSVNRLRSRYTTAMLMAWGTVWTALALAIIAIISGEQLWPRTLDGWLVVMGLAWISHVGGQSMIASSLAHLPASFGSVSLLFQPVVAAILAWVILAEPLGPWQAAGGAVVLAGILLARQGSRAPSPTKADGHNA